MVLKNSHEEWLLRLYNNEQRQTLSNDKIYNINSMTHESS